jgi:hypothetical protein
MRVGWEGLVRRLAVALVVVLAFSCNGVRPEPRPTRSPVGSPHDVQLTADQCFAQNDETTTADYSIRKYAVNVDADNDGREDVFSVCVEMPALGKGAFGGTFYRVTTAAGDVHDDQPMRYTISTAALIGPTDVDRDGGPEVWREESHNDWSGLILVAFRDGRPYEVTDVDESDEAATLGFESHPHAEAHPTRQGVECVDLDGDGSLDIVTDAMGTPGRMRFEVDPSGWSYSAYHFDGERVQEFVTDSGSGPARPPAALRFPDGFDCDGVTFAD